jgi:hypothetical protein
LESDRIQKYAMLRPQAATAIQMMKVHRDRIIALAARHRLPAVYASRIFVADGGSVSPQHLFRRPGLVHPT